MQTPQRQKPRGRHPWMQTSVRQTPLDADPHPNADRPRKFGHFLSFTTTMCESLLQSGARNDSECKF